MSLLPKQINLKVGEVENAAQMAQILMAKHQIAQGDLIVSKDDITECGFDDLRVSYEYQNYIWDLLCVIGKGYSCRVTRLKKYHPIKERIVYVFNIIGFPEDVEVVKSMTETLVPIIRAIGRDKTNKFKPVNKRKFYNSYLNGFLMGLDSKLVLSKKEKLTLTDADHQTYAMIVVKKTDLIQEYMDAKTLKTAKEVVVYGLYTDDDELGYSVSIDGKIEYLIGIYEPHGCSLKVNRGLLICWGHEQIINLWLEDGEFE
jgi:hypothetical protein